MTAVQVVNQAIGKRGIGASMAAACLGVSPWLSPMGAWMQLTGRARSTSSQASEWGHILEPVIRGYCVAKNGWDRPGVEVIVPTESSYHPELPWLRATPDGIVRETLAADIGGGTFDRLRIQVKNVGPRTSWHWGLDSRARSVPPHYRIQDAVEAAVTGIGDSVFAVLFSGNEYAEFAITRDLDLEAQIVESLAAFWRLVETDTPPEIDHADEWRSYFADRLPPEKVACKADPISLEPWIERWMTARAAAKQAAIDESTAKNQILAAAVAARANRIESDHGLITVVQPKGRDPYVKAPQSWGVE